jgi:xanthine dehydrogenase YagS FAD-binding subunit
MERLRHRITTGEIVDISQVAGMDRIALHDDGSVTIGAQVTIHAFANSALVKERYPGLAMAAAALATPQVRRAATMGGALLQRNRCSYYRHEEISCFKKGGNACPSREGNHEFGVLFDLGPCVSPHPSTLGMAMLAYDAVVDIHGKGPLKIAALYGDGSNANADHTLAQGDVLTGIHLPPSQSGEMAHYFRSISRSRAEWPLVEVLVRGFWRSNALADCRVVVGGVANIPMELRDVSQLLNGQSPSEELIQQAAALASKGAKPLRDTQYKVAQLNGAVYHTIFEAFTEPTPENQLIED